MKIRNGFVSNSSSSSFLMYGLYIDNDELNCSSEQFYNKLEEMVSGTCLDHESSDYYEGAYIGTSWSHVKDDETGHEFKERVLAGFSKFPLKDIKLGTCEDAWRDG